MFSYKMASLIAMSALVLVSCRPAEVDQKVIRDLFEYKNPPPVDAPVPQANCFNDRFRQPDAIVTKKVDILFVTDTSGSLDEEREGIANGISSFVSELPADADYTIAVMLGHSSRSPWHGRLYKYRSEPVVLTSAMGIDQVRSHLTTKLTNTAGDNYSDGGEEGLYSMATAFASNNMTESRAAGFFRNDAALAVIFISDENDICATYPEGVTPVPDLDGSEVVAKPRDCGDVSAQSVFNQIKVWQGDRPLMISGIIYNNPATVPQGGENEVGYGYTDMIRLGNGVSIDMANGQYEVGLRRIGEMTSIKLNLLSEFNITRQGFDARTLQVYVDGTSVAFNYEPILNQVRPSVLGTGGSTIDVGYCMPLPGEDDDGGGGPIDCPYNHPDDLNCDGRHDTTGELIF